MLTSHCSAVLSPAILRSCIQKGFVVSCAVFSGAHRPSFTRCLFSHFRVVSHQLQKYLFQVDSDNPCSHMFIDAMFNISQTYPKFLHAQLVMSDQPGLGRLWDFLRQAGTQHLAVVLVKHGIHDPDDIVREASMLTQNGVSESEMERLLSSFSQLKEPTPSGRSDLPVVVSGPTRASFSLALQAAHVNNRKRSLELLEADINARSTKPAADSCLKTYRSLAAAWQIDPFPLTIDSVKCVGASLKAGCYRSANIYFQTAINHQLRCLREPVHPLIRSTIRDVVRSIKRGLGPSKLKDGFDPLQLASVIAPGDDRPFDIREISHLADIVLLGCWFMLREIELAAASRHHMDRRK